MLAGITADSRELEVSGTIQQTLQSVSALNNPLRLGKPLHKSLSPKKPCNGSNLLWHYATLKDEGRVTYILTVIQHKKKSSDISLSFRPAGMIPMRREQGDSASSGLFGSTPQSICVLQISPWMISLNMPSPPTHTTLSKGEILAQTISTWPFLKGQMYKSWLKKTKQNKQIFSVVLSFLEAQGFLLSFMYNQIYEDLHNTTNSWCSTFSKPAELKLKVCTLVENHHHMSLSKKFMNLNYVVLSFFFIAFK